MRTWSHFQIGMIKKLLLLALLIGGTTAMAQADNRYCQPVDTPDFGVLRTEIALRVHAGELLRRHGRPASGHNICTFYPAPEEVRCCALDHDPYERGL